MKTTSSSSDSFRSCRAVIGRDGDDRARAEVDALGRVAEQHRQRPRDDDEDLFLRVIAMAAPRGVRRVAPEAGARVLQADGVGEVGHEASGCLVGLRLALGERQVPRVDPLIAHVPAPFGWCGYGAAVILVVAATARELEFVVGAETLVCGIGPVESALATAGALAGVATDGAPAHRDRRRADARAAGARPRFRGGLRRRARCAARRFRASTGSSRIPRCSPLARRVLPGRARLPIATTGRVGGGGVCEVEAMEGFGVLRAAARAGVPALELRAVSNAVGEPDRARWRIDDALAALASSVPRLIDGAAMPELPPPLPPETRTVGQVIAETIRAYGEKFWPRAGARAAARDRRPGAHQGDGSPSRRSSCGRVRRSSRSAFVRACSLLLGRRPTWTAFWLAVLIWLPFPFLNIFYILPAARVARLHRDGGSGRRWSRISASARRSRAAGSSARADFVHALGSLAALVIVIGIADETLCASCSTRRATRGSARPSSSPTSS